MRGVARVLIVGADRVARVTAFAQKFFPGAEYGLVEANGQPGLLLVRDGAPVALVSATMRRRTSWRRTSGRRGGSPHARSRSDSAPSGWWM
ncbi:hypothetical protein [Streptomyces ferrugineus]|uniref:hypothetical protein n=1 Tax=Streptomyces ferrugineus TaxID=1413221 RepID=UPI001D157BF7|nr:hypothetical protein [Streptomyces ferrugineus]